jgi:hypothetical protein
MESGVKPAGDLTPREKILLAEYAEVCKGHAGITDFRAKLLALLPIASGAGIALLIARESDGVSRTEAAMLIALGIFGAVITAGLFLYEFRQTDLCKQLRNHAFWIEKQLGIDAGQFGGTRERLSLREIYSPSVLKLREEELSRVEKEGEPRTASKPDALADPATSTAKPISTDKPGLRARARRLVPKQLHRLVCKQFIGAETAGYVVYHAVIITWLLMAAFGLAKLV